MNWKNIKREISLLEDNLEYIKELNKVINSEDLLTLSYKIKSVEQPGTFDLRGGWEFIEDEIKEVLKEEIRRTEEALEGIAERLGTDVETLLEEECSNEVISNEQYLLDKIMDKKSVDLADKIMKNSDVNLESEKYPHSGLIYSIQMLRLEGLSDNEILDVAKDTRLADLVYQLYEVEPRRISGANELYEILANFADDNNIEFDEMIKAGLN